MRSKIIRNIGHLVTLEPLVSQPNDPVTRDRLGILKDAWLYCEDGKVKEVGLEPVPGHFSRSLIEIVDAQGGLVLPGLVDSHTHPLFAGNRFNEFAQRLDGATYQEIAKAGGGIQSSVKHTREASDETLHENCVGHLQTFLKHGVTTVEAKTGYGLSVDEELRHLRILADVRRSVSQELVITCLALHARPPEYSHPRDYIQDLCTRLMPILVEEKLAHCVDAFIEAGYYTGEEIAPFLELARRAGIGIRLHADEFSDTGGAAAAAHWAALSADHLQFANTNGIRAMAKQGVVATLLPGTALYTKIPYADARRFFEQGCAVALATDFNPGSCPIDNLPLIATVGALHCGLSTAQAIAAVTYFGAKALGLHHRKGALAPGYDADFCILEMESVDEWIADMGRHLPNQVYIKSIRQGTKYG